MENGINQFIAVQKLTKKLIKCKQNMIQNNESKIRYAALASQYENSEEKIRFLENRILELENEKHLGNVHKCYFCFVN